LPGTIIIVIEMQSSEIRRRLIHEARHRYILTGTTRNITHALEMLLNDRPDLFEGIKPRITQRETDRPRTILDQYERPACPTCQSNLFLKPKCSGLQAGDYFYIWTCKKCGFEEYSDLTLPEILATLKPKEG
jgi:hypothetical protein